MTRSSNVKLFCLVFFATLITAQVRATEPLALQPTSRGDFASVLTVSGSIHQITKQSAMIALFANKPFWGPPHYGGAPVCAVASRHIVHGKGSWRHPDNN